MGSPPSVYSWKLLGNCSLNGPVGGHGDCRHAQSWMFHDRDRAHASRVGNAHWAPDGTSCQGSGEAAPIVPSGDIVGPMKTYIGRSVPRLEDPPLVRGRGRFAGDISVPHQLPMRLARAPGAHGPVAAGGTAAGGAAPAGGGVGDAARIT